MPVYVFDGHAIQPRPVITLGDYTMVLGEDYDLEYQNNDTPGEALVHIVPLGNLAKDAWLDFKIEAAEVRSLSDAYIEALPHQSWTGSAVNPEVKVILDEKTLVAGVDYVLSYSNNERPGTATVTATGIGGYYEGSVSSTFEIVADNLEYAVVEPIPAQVWNGAAVKPDPVVTLYGEQLVRGEDYSVSYENNTSVGTATLTISATGAYVSNITTTFEIVPAEMSGTAITSIPRQEFTGSAIEPQPTVRLGPTVLTPGTDYTLSYANNVQVGTATITLTGMGNMTGSTSVTFEIVESLNLIASGTWGTCPWEISEDGVLTIRPGVGAKIASTSTVSVWYDYRDVITSAVFVTDAGQMVVAPSSVRYLFAFLENLTSVDTTGLDLSATTDMQSMFYDCPALASIDVSEWDTSNVERMDGLFSGCSSLTSLDVSGWNTSNVWTLGGMFGGCSSLNGLDVSRWNTANVEYLHSVFSGCSSLTAINVSGWNTAKVKDMSGLFSGCSSLAEVDVSGWRTSRVEDMMSMFEGCELLTSLNVSGWNTSNVTSFQGMFQGCSALTGLDVTGWNTSNATNLSHMFSGCSSLATLDPSGWDTTKVEWLRGIFRNCSSLTSLDLSGWSVGLVEKMDYLFAGCSSLTSLDVSTWEPYVADDMSSLFADCSSLTSLDVSDWRSNYLTDMSSIFRGCSSLTSLDVSSWNTTQVTDMGTVFSGCSSLASLDVSYWETGRVTDMGGMFGSCSSLRVIDLSRWDTSHVTNMGAMFSGCTDLVMVGATNWNTVGVTQVYNMFSSCPALATVYVGDGWTTASVPASYYQGMFDGSSSLVGGNGTAYDAEHTTLDSRASTPTARQGTSRGRARPSGLTWCRFRTSCTPANSSSPS